jgi:hypothetical protein
MYMSLIYTCELNQANAFGLRINCGSTLRMWPNSRDRWIFVATNSPPFSSRQRIQSAIGNLPHELTATQAPLRYCR